MYHLIPVFTPNKEGLSSLDLAFGTWFDFGFIGISAFDFDLVRFPADFNGRFSSNEFTNSSLYDMHAIVEWVCDNEENYFGTKLIKFVWQRHRIHSTHRTCAQIYSNRVNENGIRSHAVISPHQQWTDEPYMCPMLAAHCTHAHVPILRMCKSIKCFSAWHSFWTRIT